MSKKMRILIVGGSSLIAEHCAREWSYGQACELILLGRDLEKLHRVAQDLQVRSPSSAIDCQIVDFLNVNEIEQCITHIQQQGGIDIALIAHGVLPDQIRCENDSNYCQQTIQINAISPVLFLETVLKQMLQQASGKIAIIGSVAGDRGRKSNYVYGAAKSFIETYVEGVQHRLALEKSNVSVTLIKPGPVLTPMTEGLTGKGKMANPAQVAKQIVQAVNRSDLVLYTPSKWALIMFIVRNLPFFIFKKMDV